MKRSKRLMGIALAGMMMLSAVAVPQAMPEEVQESYSIVQTVEIEANAAEWRKGGFAGGYDRRDRGPAWNGPTRIWAKTNWRGKYKSPRIYVYAYSEDGRKTSRWAGNVLQVQVCDWRGYEIYRKNVYSGQYIDLKNYTGYQIKIRRSNNTGRVRQYTEWWAIKVDNDGYFG